MSIIAYVGDIHAGSYTAVCPPKVPLDRGGHYHASRLQTIIYEHWLSFWDEARDRAIYHDEELWGVVGGEFVEGDHHGTSSIISSNLADQRRIAKKLFKPIRSWCTRWYVVRGSAAHSGEAGREDEELASYLKAERQEGQDRSTDIVRFACGGHNLRFQHHGWGAMRPWTWGANVLRHAAALTYNNYKSKPEERPDLSVHGHFHRFGDSGKAHPVRVIYVGGWKFPDSYINKLNVDDTPSKVGGLIIHASEGKELVADSYELELARPKYV